jgi:hypothetical protein
MGKSRRKASQLRKPRITQPSKQPSGVPHPKPASTSNEVPAIQDSGLRPEEQLDDRLPHDLYLEERKLLLDLQKANTEQFDKAILTVSSGAIGLSIVFMYNLIPDPIESTKACLIGGWFLLLLSILAMIASFLFGQWACDQRIDVINSSACGDPCPVFRVDWAWWTRTLNLFAFLFFVLGVAAILTFASVNFYYKQAPATTESSGDKASAKEPESLVNQSLVPASASEPVAERSSPEQVSDQ